jgi:hypothetical protein
MRHRAVRKQVERKYAHAVSAPQVSDWPPAMPDRQQATGASQTGSSSTNTGATTTDKSEANKPGMRATEVPVMSDEERARARTRLGVGTTMNDVPDRARANMRQLTIDDLEDMDVYNARVSKSAQPKRSWPARTRNSTW